MKLPFQRKKIVEFTLQAHHSCRLCDADPTRVVVWITTTGVVVGESPEYCLSCDSCLPGIEMNLRGRLATIYDSFPIIDGKASIRAKFWEL